MAGYNIDNQIKKQQETLELVVNMRKKHAASQKQSNATALILIIVTALPALFHQQIAAVASNPSRLAAAAPWLHLSAPSTIADSKGQKQGKSTLVRTHKSSSGRKHHKGSH